VGWALKVTLSLQPLPDLLCIPIFIPRAVPCLWQSTVSYYSTSSTIPVTKYSILHDGISSWSLDSIKMFTKVTKSECSWSHTSKTMCEAISVAIWHLPQIGLLLEEPVCCRAPFDSFCYFPAGFLWSVLVPQEPGNSNSHHPHSPMWVQGIHTTGCCRGPRRYLYRYCYHRLSAMQPLARCLTPWLL
jgi:hypothetical protein